MLRRVFMAAALSAMSPIGLVPAAALQISGLQTPQSFLADPAGNQYFISNANGDPDAKDNNGFITKVSETGTVTDLHFIQGGKGDTVLNAPKGMAIVDRILYVADLETLRGYDASTGRPIVTVSIASSQASHRPVALADVAYDGQRWLYLSDTEADTIYRVDVTRQHAVSVFANNPALAGPRGLAVHPKSGRLIVVSWNKGKILEVNSEGSVTELVANSFFSARFHNLDGVDFDSWGNMYVSDFTAGKVWRMRPDQRFDVIAEYLSSPGDIGVDRKNHLILVPYHYGNAAEMNGLESPAKSQNKKRTLSDYGFGRPKGTEGQEPK